MRFFYTHINELFTQHLEPALATENTSMFKGPAIPPSDEELNIAVTTFTVIKSQQLITGAINSELIPILQGLSRKGKLRRLSREAEKIFSCAF